MNAKMLITTDPGPFPNVHHEGKAHYGETQLYETLEPLKISTRLHTVCILTYRALSLLRCAHAFTCS